MRHLISLLLLGACNACAQQISLQAREDGLAPLTVTFNVTGTQPGDVVNWTFGDGSSASGTRLTHTYYRPGVYQARSTLRRGAQTMTATNTITVKNNGPERLRLTTLLGPWGVILSSEGSVIYAPMRPRFSVGRQVTERFPVKLSSGQYTFGLQAPSQRGQLETSVRVNYRPLPSNASFEQQVLTLTNAARAQGWNCATGRPGAPAQPPLTRERHLDQAATAQAYGMALVGYFAHQSALDDSTPMNRVYATGYRPDTVAENIASGQETPREVVDAWLKSPGHCRNIMGDFTYIGLSQVTGTSPVQPNTPYWVQVFSR